MEMKIFSACTYQIINNNLWRADASDQSTQKKKTIPSAFEHVSQTGNQFQLAAKPGLSLIGFFEKRVAGIKVDELKGAERGHRYYRCSRKRKM